MNINGIEFDENKFDDVYGIIIEVSIATDEEIKLCCQISGYNMETLNAIIYARTAYHDIEQYIECEL